MAIQVYRRVLILLLLTLLSLPACSKKPSTPVVANRSQAVSRQALEAHEGIVAKIKDIVGAKLGLDPKAIDIDAPLAKQKTAASEVDAVDIILDIENQFKIEVKEEDTGGTEHLADRLTVRKLSDIVASKKK